ncbi:50S ribosomal protein L9 [Candidatus Beckwithbacteria bacterium]|nr:50S ribosomal protein L9 [Candidatus Beckwithbacteria bacterium]
MQVLIKQTNQIEEVKDSYALNYLIPQGLAVMVTDKIKKQMAQKAKQKVEQKKTEGDKQKKLAQSFDGKTFKIKAIANEEGELYGSIDKKQIKKELKIKDSFEVEPADPIKELGSFSKTLVFGKAKATITLEVVTS